VPSYQLGGRLDPAFDDAKAAVLMRRIIDKMVRDEQLEK
jgi:hypothetical protein